jgi:hypothetical protein
MPVVLDGLVAATQMTERRTRDDATKIRKGYVAVETRISHQNLKLPLLSLEIKLSFTLST